MEITSATANPASTAATNQSASASNISSDFETFLKMLTVQMKNQDPLEPLKSEDFAVQLATFSGVEQQVKSNDLLESLGSQLSLMGMSQFAGWVGMEARAPVAAQFDGAPITLAPNPPLSADTAILVVTNADGVEIQRTPVPINGEPLEWTGQLGASIAPDGLYSFSLESYASGAPISTAVVEVYSRITEARNHGGQTFLITEGGGEVLASQVSALREPQDAI